MRFTFTGNVGLNNLSSKNPYYKDGKSENGNSWARFGCSVASAKNNRAYLKIMGSVQKTIKTMDSDNNKIEISWDDRDDEDVLKSVANFKKHVVKLNDERHEFLTEYDFVQFLREHADELKNKKFTITGQTRPNVYNGTVSHRFSIQNVFEATEDTKAQLRVSTEYFFNKDSFDTADWGTEKILNINGFIKVYISKDEPERYVPLSIVFDCSKIDFENEKHVKLMKMKLKMIGCDFVDGKVKCKLKGTDFYSMAVVLNYINGSEKAEFTADMLTETQKEFIELGLKTLDDFRPAGDVYGERITIYKLVDFDLNTIGKKDFSNGYIEADMSEDEFMELVYKAPKKETVEEAIDSAVEKKESVSEVDDDDEDLFD